MASAALRSASAALAFSAASAALARRSSSSRFLAAACSALSCLRLAPGFLRGLARRLALGARLRLALLGGLLQDVDPLLRVDRQR